jgi:hypothetical protein
MGATAETTGRGTPLVVGPDARAPSRAGGASAPGPRRGRGVPWRLIAAAGVALLTLSVCLVLAAVLHEPAALRQPASAAARAADGDAERLAGRLISKASALHNATRRPGRWEGVFTADEVNAWLATDLPRNHARLLPPGWTAPRVRFTPRQVWAGVRCQAGPLSALLWARAEVRLRSPGEMSIAVASAGVGALPLPGDALLARLAERLSASGFSASVVRLEGRNQLVVRLPDGGAADAGDKPGIRLDAVRVDDGELLLAGETVPPAPVAR